MCSPNAAKWPKGLFCGRNRYRSVIPSVISIRWQANSWTCHSRQKNIVADVAFRDEQGRSTSDRSASQPQNTTSVVPRQIAKGASEIVVASDEHLSMQVEQLRQTQRCPGCNTPTKKDDACMHMTYTIMWRTILLCLWQGKICIFVRGSLFSAWAGAILSR